MWNEFFRKTCDMKEKTDDDQVEQTTHDTFITFEESVFQELYSEKTRIQDTTQIHFQVYQWIEVRAVFNGALWTEM